ncbi:unnamed protein product [Lactuca saligna]|uniref:Uncharacterized protein n=1 Tax=Lactuca saligna TaxID=75948 RepID=A0AA35Y652_LACSI|nr:unnamed protein product [Lactuca saligna]
MNSEDLLNNCSRLRIHPLHRIRPPFTGDVATSRSLSTNTSTSRLHQCREFSITTDEIDFLFSQNFIFLDSNRKSQVNQIVKSFGLNIEIDLEVLESEFENGNHSEAKTKLKLESELASIRTISSNRSEFGCHRNAGQCSFDGKLDFDFYKSTTCFIRLNEEDDSIYNFSPRKLQRLAELSLFLNPLLIHGFNHSGHLMFTINANNRILIRTDSSERKDSYHNIMDNFGDLWF